MSGPRFDTTHLPSAQFLARPDPEPAARAAPAPPMAAPRSNTTIIVVLSVVGVLAAGTLIAIALKHANSSNEPISIGVSDNAPAPTAEPTATVAPSASAPPPRRIGKLPQVEKKSDDIYDDVDDKPKPAKPAITAAPSPVPTNLH